MAVFGKWLSLLMAGALICPGSSIRKKYLYHIPWACSVVHKDGEFISTGTLIDNSNVLVSADNLNEIVPKSDPPKRFYQVVDQIFVIAGSNFLDPYKLGNRRPLSTQKRRAVTLYVAFKPPATRIDAWVIKMNPDDISPEAGAEYDVYGLAFNVAILTVEDPFVNGPYIQPMLIRNGDLREQTRQFIADLLERPQLRAHTCLTYSWSRKLNKIRYYEVSYLPMRYCHEDFCTWNLRQCKQFPKLSGYHYCFNSVRYSDVCPDARGAALYCPNFDHSVFAILTTAPSCGQRHMPGVYTTIHMVVDFYEKALNVSFDINSRTHYDVFSLPQMNSDYVGIP